MYYARLISTPALVSPSSLLLMMILDADADDAASGAALVFVVVVVFSAVSASAATLTALTLLDFCFNDVDVLFVPPLLFDDDDAVA